ncbi:hypothetical protein CAK95_18365 [Pseudorhodoplanes sinuspersici]|uniref:Uncharacterized protein n=2 Tax=Pseudorhodoplanes sinuspersici TaxID=1235591 RepID=A0A1W6ZU46_9HYPH|nr:hypothetical protein CAK95_18365 [Pseudorhodoplanes sinuspersici]
MRLGGAGFTGAPSDTARSAFGAAHGTGGHVAALGGHASPQRSNAGHAHNGRRGHAHFRGRRNFAFYGYPYYDSFYDVPYGYYDDGCYRLVRVRTPQGLRWQRENVCY